jgi:Lipoprotein LpqB beta-propeller domain/Sporulation and spore germination
MLAAILLALTGCAGVPSGGQVVGGRAATGHQQPIDDPYVRVIPVGPGHNWDPGTIINAFQAASGSFDGPNGEHKVAREYLGCGSCWRPGVSTVVYDRIVPSSVQLDGDRATVTEEVDQLGRIGSDGQYLADSRHFKQTYELRQDAQKQWRITQLPQELLLSRNDVNRAFRTLNLYFFAPDSQVLVPNPVFIPLVNRNWLSQQLVKQLIGGPTTWMKYAFVRTGFPAGTQLKRLDISGGLATVDLTRQARTGDLRNMSIQLMWTLRQLREVDQLKLEIDGKAVHVPGVSGTVQSADDWSGFDPDGNGDEVHGYVRSADGRLARLDDAVPQVLLDKLRVSHPAVSYDTRQVASLGGAGNTVTVTDLAHGTSRVVLHAQLKGGKFSTPSWDTRGNVWAVESNSHGSRLWEIEGGTKTLNVDGWSLAPYPVKALRISRDGSRAAAIVQIGKWSQVQLGRVDRAPTHGLQAEGFIPISSDLQGAIDLTWRDADHLAVIGVTASNPSPLLYDVPVSGAAIQPMVGPGSDMKAIAAYPGAPLLVMQHVSNPQSLDMVCRLSDRYGEWKCFDGTSDPAYPG